jgi:hypothetical protein
MRYATFAVACLAAVFTISVQGQSKNPFGIPSAEAPQPGAGIKAMPGSRAQG